MLRRAGARSRKALRCSTAQKGPKSNTVVCFANFPYPRLASHRLGVRTKQSGFDPRSGPELVEWSARHALRVFVDFAHQPFFANSHPFFACHHPLQAHHPPVRAEVSKPRANTSTPPSRCAASRVWCSAPPSDELSSTGLCGSARQRASTTDFGRLSERSGRRPRSEFCPTRKDRAAQGSPRTARAESAGSLSFPPFFVDTKKGGRLPGRNPGAASRSEQDHPRVAPQGFDTSAERGGACEPSWIPASAEMTGLA
jgi:hypothetical protein